MHDCPECGTERLNTPSCPACPWEKRCSECGALEEVRAIGHGWSCSRCGTRYGLD